MARKLAGIVGFVVCAAAAGCGGGGGGNTTGQSAITGVTVSVTPTAITAGQTAQATATVSGTGNYSSAVTWSVGPSGIGTISSSGLFTSTGVGTATITATSTQDSTQSGNAQVTVNSAVKVSISPDSPTVTIGASEQFTAAVSSGSTPAWNWTVTPPSGWTGDVGTISSTGLYQTPYPAPSTVTITATSATDSTLSGSTTATLAPPVTATGPVLTVDVGNQLHSISPLIYGANGWQLDSASAATANFSIVRWGGDATSRYNYKLNTTNSASDWYFENFSGMNGGYPNPNTTAAFSDFVSAADAAGMEVLGTVPVQGWVSNNITNSNSGATPACSFPQSTYPGQAKYDGTCGNGICPNGSACGTSTMCTNSGGCSLLGDKNTVGITSQQELAPACTMNCSAAMPAGSMSATQTGCIQTCAQANMPSASQATAAWAQGTWAGGWVNSIVANSSYGNGASGKGVAMWDLDNEPAWWDAVHRDVHPAPSTYDEVTWGDISTALAIKTADPTAKVDGPVIDYWWNYFYSKQDIENGWGSGPCYQPWDHPADRTAHGGTPLIGYVLQQFQQAESTYGMRLLDYVTIHGYVAGTYNGNSVAFTTAGDTAEQMVRMNSTRALWDPTYTDKNFPQPNYTSDLNYTSSCNVPLQAPELVPMLRSWVATYYPGTKTSIDEYNFGGLESINGAVTQADVLGIFGQYGLDLATLWPTDIYTKQEPANEAFAIYRNYDGAKSAFGDTALASCSTAAALTSACTPGAPLAADETGQGQLSVYGALRSSDNAITVVVINKTYGPLTSTLSLANVSAVASSASVYQYSGANLAQIVKQSDATVAPPASGSTTATLTYTFPGQSITLFVIPQ